MKKQAFNPYLPEWEYIPDGEPRVFDGRLYIYGSHDRFGTMSFCLNDYVCWSAPVDDLSDWRYDGVLYKKTQDPRNADGKHFMEAPDVVCYKGEYYLFYSLSELSAVAVAKCDKPCGPFEFYGFVRHADGRILGTDGGDRHQFDPGVYVEGDEIYLYTGNGPLQKEDDRYIGSQVMQLMSDMLTLKTEPKILLPTVKDSEGTGFEGHEFYEASSMRKIGDKYYFIYSSVLSHELCYATSDYPDRDFVYGGTLVSNANVGYKGQQKATAPIGNTHGSLVEVDGQWYIFYHRQTNATFFARQGCAEPVDIVNGKIGQAEMTSCGLNGGPLSGMGSYPACIACYIVGPDGYNDYNITEEMQRDYMHGFSSPLIDGWVKLTKTLPYITQDEPDGDKGVQYVKYITRGACVGYKYFKFDGKSSVRVITRGNGNGKIYISTEPNGEPIGSVDITASNEWTVSERSELHTESAVCALFFRYDGDSDIDFLEFILG